MRGNTFMRIGLIFALSALALCGAAAAGPAQLRFSWSGEMRQIETTTETTYPMTLTLKGEVLEATYPTLNCIGTWTKIAENAETVTNQQDASCIDGIAMVTWRNGRAFVGWYSANAGEPIVAIAVLESK
jgi:hypothetical protein